MNPRSRTAIFKIFFSLVWLSQAQLWTTHKAVLITILFLNYREAHRVPHKETGSDSLLKHISEIWIGNPSILRVTRYLSVPLSPDSYLLIFNVTILLQMLAFLTRQKMTRENNPILLTTNTFWGVFITLSNIYDKTFYKNSYRLKVVNYFRKTLHLSCFAGFWIGLWPRVCR